MDGTLAMVDNPKKAGRRIVGQAITTNPLVAAVALIDEAVVDDLDVEIATTENYLAGLKAMRNLAGQAIGKPVVQPAQQAPAPAPRKPKAPPPPEDEEDDDDEELHVDDAELADIDAADAKPRSVWDKPPEEKPKKPKQIPPAGHKDRAAAEDRLRRKVCRYIHPLEKVRRADIMYNCGLSPRTVADFLNHPWFQVLECGNWALTKLGEEEGLAEVGAG